jgi:hypothetical protein
MALMASASLSRRWTARSTVGCGGGDCMEAAAAHAALARRWCRNSIQGRRATSPQIDWPALTRPQKITLAEMRAAGVSGIMVYCSDDRCSHWTRLNADQWPDDLRLSDLEPKFVCQACGHRGADVRPDWRSRAQASG